MITFQTLFILCLIQGITEFLPISSSAHLQVFNGLLDQSALSREWEVALHSGTLLAVILYFWYDLWRMIGAFLGLFHKNYRAYALSSPHGQMMVQLVIATIPAVIIGFAIKRLGLEFNSLHAIALNSIIFGILLFVTDYFGSNNRSITISSAVIIGLGQSLAFLPGVSRSGICLTVARFLGINRILATRFTFLLSIPAVLGAVTLTTFDLIKEDITIHWGQIFQATIITAIIGLIVIHSLLRFLQTYSFTPFAIYRVIFGAWLLFGL